MTTFLLGLLVVINGQLLGAVSAAADVTCTSSPQAQVEGAAHTSGGSFYNNAKGVFSSIWINPSVNDNCIRVSSIAVIDNATGAQAEVGVQEATGQTGCDGSNISSPTKFLAWQTPLISFDCTTDGSPGSSGQYRDFKVQDINQDGVWSAYIGSTNFAGTPDLGSDLTHGNPIDNGERHNSGDSEYSQFANLQYYAKSGSSYTDFYDVWKFVDTDGASNYNCIRISSTSNYVKAVTATCDG